MNVSAATPTHQALERGLRWWRTALHAAVTCVVIAVVSQNATHPSPVRPADGTLSVPHVRPLP